MTRTPSFVEQLIRQRAGDHPDHTWLKWKDTTVTWGEVLSNIRRVANGLLELGVRPGERVAIMAANRPEFLWAHFGSMFIGAQSVPVNISQRGVTLSHILGNSDATAVIVQDDLRDVIESVRKDTPAIRHAVVIDGVPGRGVDWDFDRLMGAEDVDPDVEVADAGGAGAMLYTSGTTGPPKGVVSTSDAGAAVGAAVIGSLGVGAGDTMYTALPLFHGNALLVSVIGSIVLDAALALAERFSASRLLEDCRRHQAVEFNTLGGMISILLKQPPRPDDRDHSVRTVLSAGCPPDRWEEFERRFGVRLVEFYGMIDSPGLLLNAEGRIGSMGKPVGGVEFQVVDGNEKTVGPGQVGELVFRHPLGATTAYHKLPDATAEAYRGGWFHSGDLAECDAEGFFYYRGRKKESIRRRGENISAWEIETVLNAHPKVLEAAAYAVPSELGEDEVMVSVIPMAGEEVVPEDLVAYCEGKMARYAVPRYVELVDELPKTETQRVRYGELRARGITNTAWDRERAGQPTGAGT